MAGRRELCRDVYPAAGRADRDGPRQTELRELKAETKELKAMLRQLLGMGLASGAEDVYA